MRKKHNNLVALFIQIAYKEKIIALRDDLFSTMHSALKTLNVSKERGLI